jgi:hypothetical protein
MIDLIFIILLFALGWNYFYKRHYRSELRIKENQLQSMTNEYEKAYDQAGFYFREYRKAIDEDSDKVLESEIVE